MASTSQNTVMLKKFQNFREYGPGLDIDARISEFWNFLSITGFREVGDSVFWNFLIITVFCETQATKHCVCKPPV